MSRGRDVKSLEPQVALLFWVSGILVPCDMEDPLTATKLDWL